MVLYLCSMKRRYIALKNLVLNGESFPVGRVIPHNKLKYLSEQDKKFVHIQDFSTVQLPFNYGLIFLSTEFPHPQYHEEESLECILKRLKCEMKRDCKRAKIFDKSFDKTFE